MLAQNPTGAKAPEEHCPSHLGIGSWSGVAQPGCPPTPSQAIGTLRGEVAPLGMNGF